MPPNPLSNPHGFDMQISKFKKTILGLPPPLPNPGDATVFLHYKRNLKILAIV